MSNFDTSGVLYMFGVFSGCSGLSSLDVSKFDTSNATNIAEMFKDCSSLSCLEVSNFKTTNAMYMQGMFKNCSGLSSLDVSNFDTSGVLYMGEMFSGCSGLRSLDVSNFNTSKAWYMEYMFYGCSGLDSLDLSNFDTSNVMNMFGMFWKCSGLRSLDLRNFNISNSMSEYMFNDCSSLIEFRTPCIIGTGALDLPAVFADPDGNETSKLTSDFQNMLLVKVVKKDPLPAPTNVKIDKNYVVSWELPAGLTGEEWFSWVLYKEDGTVVYSFEEMVDYSSTSVSQYIMETGTYYVEVSISPSFDDEEHKPSEKVRTELFTYTRPITQLGTTIAVWSSDEPGVIFFPVVKGTFKYEVYLYKEEWIEGVNDYIWDWWAMRTVSAENQSQEIKMDFNDYISKYGAGRYRIAVQAFSGNINEIANGKMGDFSAIYDTTQTAQSVADSLNSATVENPDDAAAVVDALKNAQDMRNIQISMQTDEIVLQKMMDLEDSYETQKKVKVSQDVTPEAAEYVDADSIVMVGAAFSANENSNITLVVDVPEKEVELSSNKYTNQVQLSIKLENNGVEVKELKMPITITIPIPEGITASQLELLHYSEDGSYEVMIPKVNNDNTVTFTVTHFSTFVFADKSGQAVSGKVTSFGDETAQTTVRILDGNESEVARTTVVGKSATYTLEGILPGTYTLEVSKANHVTRQYSITVESEAVVQDAGIWLIGDVNGDGNINSKDKKVLFNHIAGNSVLTDYAFLVGDITGDGNINSKDKKAMFNHIANISKLW